MDKPIVEFHKNGTWFRPECKECACLNQSLYYKMRKGQDAPAPGTPCECCGDSTSVLNWDHDHETGKHRGWICSNCNTGIGKLGDNLEGVTKAVEYLKRVDNIQEPENEINGVCDI